MNNYKKGYGFEREIKLFLESDGWFVIRTAGSHSPFDLIAFKENKRPLFLQLKRGKKIYSNRLIEEVKLNIKFNNLEWLDVFGDIELWVREDNGVLKKYGVFF